MFDSMSRSPGTDERRRTHITHLDEIKKARSAGARCTKGEGRLGLKKKEKTGKHMTVTAFRMK